MEIQLGGKEITKTKALFILFYIFNLVFLYYLAIGATPAERNVIYFYTGMELVALVLIVSVDMLSYGKKEIPYVDSVLHETTSPLSLKYQLLIGFVLSMIIGLWIATTGQAFVKANPFNITFQIMQTKEGVCYLFVEAMWNRTIGADRYVEVVPNSVDFLYGDD